MFLSKRNKAKENKSSHRISPFRLHYFSWKKNKLFVESADNVMVTSAIPKKSTKYAEN